MTINSVTSGQATHPAICIDCSGRLLFANSASKQILSQWVSPAGEFLLPAQWLSHIQSALSNKISLSVETVECGRTYEVDLVPVSETQTVFMYWFDITKRQKTNMERRLLSRALEQATEIVIITDAQGIIQYVNPAFVNVTQYSALEAIGKNPRMLKSGRHEPAFYAGMWECIKRGENWTGRLINRKKDGTLYEEDTSISPVRDEQGSIVNFVGVKRDVSEQLSLERQLRQAQKMEAIGTLAGGIAHDFNNILGAIIGYTDLTLEMLDRKGEEHNHLEQVMLAASRAKELIRQILTFSRQSEMEKIPVDMRLIVNEVLKLLRSSLPSTIRIKQDVTRELCLINADPTQIHQVLMNLCTNASHAMGYTPGILTVRLHIVRRSAGSELLPITLCGDQYVVLQVRDTGHGMDSRTRERVFEPFFTTKAPGVGTGMGLSVVHGIVQSHAGDITIESEVGCGACFTVYLPLIEVLTQADGVEIVGSIPGGHERILVVDDEPSLRMMIAEMLQPLGYTVTQAVGSLEALHLYGASPASYDLIITDQTMPDLPGLQLARHCLEINGNCRIILCTGYGESVTAEMLERSGVKSLVLKPFSKKRLAETVRKVLDCQV